MKKIETFSIRARGRSFRYAIEGILDFFRTQHNALIHLVATIFVIVAAIVMRVTATEMIALVLAAGFVWVAEIVNTAIEKTMDLISQERDERIRYIKDLAAAAVLISALAAVIVGCIVFIPKLI